MIPYVKVPELTIGPVPLHAFGLLVATGVVVGSALATKRARTRGFDVELLNSFITWMLIGGFVGGHVLDEIFYHPEEIAQNPLSLLKLWAGLSSFGGFTGGFIGVILWKYFDFAPERPGGRSRFVRNRPARPILPFTDIIISVFPVAWIFGRGGCASVHDHPGDVAPAGSWLAVQFPSINPAMTGSPGEHHDFGPIHFVAGRLIQGHYPRYDLGFIELCFTIVLALILATTWRKRLATGTYAVVASLAYAPVRFVMDFLRIRTGDGADPRYVGLTPAQWECIALFSFGLYLLWLVRRIKASGVDPAAEFMVDRPRRPVVQPAPG